MEGTVISGNTSNFRLTIRNARYYKYHSTLCIISLLRSIVVHAVFLYILYSEQHNGILQFTAWLENSTNSTQTLIIIPSKLSLAAIIL